MLNFTLQDLTASALAFLLFPFMFVAPGYATAWLFDLFDFRKRLPATRFVIAVVISTAVSPILVFLTWRLLSVAATFIMLGLFAVATAIILFKTKWPAVPHEVKRLQTFAICIGLGWTILSILSLTDIQWGDRLYYNVVSYDFTSRVAVINAMTRSGVPPINPSYFPGHNVQLTYLYYFWYIPCSLVAQLGGPWVNGRVAMIASVAWCGLALMATIALYLRLRNPAGGVKAWKSALVGSGLLLVSGLDFIPALLLMITARVYTGSTFLQGDIEHWNEQITAWVGAISWVPHHVAAMIACLAGMMLAHSARGKSFSRQALLLTIAGLAFASAFGLSVYVTLVFVVFWAIWMIALFLQKERQIALVMALAGIIAAVAVSPFIAGIIKGGSGSSGGFPIALAVRTFLPILYIFPSAPAGLLNLASLLLLPVNYLLELGFFFIAGLLWLKGNGRSGWRQNQFHTAEIILLLVVAIVCSFVRSTSIESNDLGWRGWLPGQFILLVWGADVIARIFPDFKIRASPPPSKPDRRTWNQLRILLILGLITTIVDITILRTWTMLVDAGVAGFPNLVSTDEQLGKRTFAAREAYEFINQNTPPGIRIQQNPNEPLNIPIGLYANRAIAISGHTAYGVSQEEFLQRVALAEKIFQSETTWAEIDQSCKDNFIDAIAVKDEDPLWKRIPSLENTRSPLYKNQYYAIFSCGHPIKP